MWKSGVTHLSIMFRSHVMSKMHGSEIVQNSHRATRWPEIDPRAQYLILETLTCFKWTPVAFQKCKFEIPIPQGYGNMPNVPGMI